MRKSVLGTLAIAILSFSLGYWLASDSGHDRIGVISAELATDDADAKFARDMFVRYQLAIEAAKKVLQEGRNPEIRTRAEEIVRMQASDVAWFRDWLTKNTVQTKTPAN